VLQANHLSKIVIDSGGQVAQQRWSVKDSCALSPISVDMEENPG
jgi:hypothetical protein